jgi:hypothetical protein
MASSTNINYMNMENAGGLDVVVGNARVRASATAGTNSLGTLYMQGTGAPTVFTTGAQTLTAANLLTGIITGAPAGAVTYTTDTAVNIITAMQNASAGVAVGDYLECMLCNDAVAANTITVAGGTGVTVQRGANAAIAGGVSVNLMFRITSLASSTITVYY